MENIYYSSAVRLRWAKGVMEGLMALVVISVLSYLWLPSPGRLSLLVMARLPPAPDVLAFLTLRDSSLLV
ncbi:MAG: hypothetical protein KTR25_18190 [Myxococcales bacterium]|nr:hypothetical protein [Myxococcales bacterium]